ncbi:uncharacterized protein L3040_005621 [Drepanopeziza brunnea f. sp. 'multigermtubi']|uniref:uncharacterized protein n=1 Tax=Drepanopeziza brunnea f. sp. 'multigermtubi' TaxID=698441 RepID=UPI002382BC82|nr:hypothetical protein L3040_005621 [Drepanopeziza brunnea f. sp. 'multigermtubi']
MPGPKRIIFDPDGDVLLRFSCPLAPIAPKDYLCRDSGSEKLAVAKVTNKPQDIAKVTPRKVEMLVSSKHLALVSPVFKAMFRPGFKEGHELSTTGKLNLPLDDDDPTAWEVILNIIHCRLEYVPCRSELCSPLDGNRLGVQTQRGILHCPPHSTANLDSRNNKSGYNSTVAHTFCRDRTYQFGPPTNYVGAFSKKKMMACDSMVIRSLLGSASKLGLWPPSVARSNFGDSSFQSTAAAIRRVTIHTLCDDIFGVRGPLEVNVETRHFTKELLDQQLAKIESRMDRYSLQDLPL